MMGLMEAPLKRKRGRPRKGQGPIDYTVDCREPSEFGEGRSLKGEEFKRRKKELERLDRERRERAR